MCHVLVTVERNKRKMPNILMLRIKQSLVPVHAFYRKKLEGLLFLASLSDRSYVAT